jgi:hypothetical protein
MSTAHDNSLADKIYSISGVTSVQIRLYPLRQDEPMIGSATFDVKLNVDGSVQITNLAKNYKITMSPV